MLTACTCRGKHRSGSVARLGDNKVRMAMSSAPVAQRPAGVLTQRAQCMGPLASCDLAACCVGRRTAAPAFRAPSPLTLPLSPLCRLLWQLAVCGRRPPPVLGAGPGCRCAPGARMWAVHRRCRAGDIAGRPDDMRDGASMGTSTHRCRCRLLVPDAAAAALCLCGRSAPQPTRLRCCPVTASAPRSPLPRSRSAV